MKLPPVGERPRGFGGRPDGSGERAGRFGRRRGGFGGRRGGFGGGGGAAYASVIANGKLYVRDQDLLFCYDVKAKREAPCNSGLTLLYCQNLMSGKVH